MHAPIISDETPSQRRRFDRWHGALLVVLLIAAVLRLNGLGAHSFWTDEFYALEISAGRPWAHAQFPANADEPRALDPGYVEPVTFSPLSIWAGQVRDSHPPAYFLLLNAVRVVFGTNETVARWPSVIFSLLLLWVVYRGVATQVSRVAAIGAVAILSFSALQIGYAQEARNYTMVSAILYAIVWLLLRAQQRQRWAIGDLIALTTLFYLAPLTHYLSVGPLIAIGVYGTVSLRGRMRNQFLLAAGVAASVYAVSWGPFLLAQYRNDIGSMMRWTGVHPAQTVPDIIKRVLVWPWTALAFDTHTPFRIRYLGAALLVGPLLMSLWHKPARVWVMMTWAVLGSVAIGDWWDQTDRLSVWRYTLLAGPAYVAAIVVAATGFRSVRLRFLRLAVPAIVFAWCVVRMPLAYLPRNTDVRPMIALASRDAPEGDQVVVLCGPPRASWQAKSQLLAFDTDDPRASRPRFVVLTRPASPTLMQALNVSPHLFVLGMPGADVNALLPGVALSRVGEYRGLGVALVGGH